MSEEVLSIRNLRKNFGEKEVLKGVNLDVYRGQIIGYIGPNGAGKSTTVKILLGLEGDYTGEIKIFGRDISNGDITYKKKLGTYPRWPMFMII